MRRVPLVAGAVLYLLGGVVALFWVVTVARADTSLLHIEGPAAPALELQPGVYEIRELATEGGAPSPASAVFVLKTREVLPLVASAGGRSFKVPGHGVYVLDVRTAGAVSVQAREQLVLSPTLIFALTLAPVGTIPGLLLLDGARSRGRREVELGRSRFALASARRRLIAVVFDLVAIAALLVLLILVTPLFPLGAPFIPLAPIAYVWAGAARGSSIGRWVAGIRVVNARGEAPGAWAGLLRSVGWLLSWALLGGGYVIAALGAAGRAPHDELAGTYVVID